ncbi:glycoside hydrolase family 28 protein (plasmid) [Skermanella rosea]|uniref:glycoside hydrolase family 28 protein n=1 Tax=Skermanella rosea TaxID=1817965 RepID=UPI0019333C8B|nr:glycoside hydrolase family 28 protein [Skermanella rosea]UEM07302.1 glycoside hydrolase family 28 protein [Skermanella rosea]
MTSTLFRTAATALTFGVAVALGAGSGPAGAAEASAQSTPADWTMAGEIVGKIRPPSIPDRDYAVTAFGASGDGKQDARPAILAAIEQASREGGGRVVLPKGVWLSKGPIHLKSRIDLHLAEGATLLFGPDAANYLPEVKTRWEGTELMGYSPLIYARDVEDVAITGKGTIDGNAASEFHGWKAKEKPDQLALRQMGISGVPVEQRRFGGGHFLRPSMIQFFGAKRVLLEDYTLKNSPFWVNHLVYTDHAIVRGLNVDSHMANNDGIDVDSSTYVLIEKNVFRTGDDSVVVKSGRDLDGRQIGRPSEYVVVRNNDLGGEDGIALGSEMSGDIRHVFFDDNVLRKGASAIRFKGNLDRGGVVEHIRVRNMAVESFDTLFWFQLNYPGELGGNFPPVYRDIVFENFTVEKVGTVFDAHGPEAAPLRDVLLKNVTIAAAEKPLVVENVEGLRFENVLIGKQRVDGTLDWR